MQLAAFDTAVVPGVSQEKDTGQRMKMAGSTWDRWGPAEGQHHRDRSRERSSHYCSRQCSAPPRGDGAPACVQQREQSTMCAEQARAQPSSVYWARDDIARDCQQRMTERGTNLDRDQLRRPERAGSRSPRAVHCLGLEGFLLAQAFSCMPCTETCTACSQTHVRMQLSLQVCARPPR